MMLNSFDRRLLPNLIIILSILAIDCKKVPTPSNIHDGERAGEHEFPYIVAINGTYEGPSYVETTYGAGVLVGKRFVLTIKPVAFVMENNKAVHARKLRVFPKYDNDLHGSVYGREKALKVEKKFCMTKKAFHHSEDLVLLKLEDDYPEHYNVKPIEISPRLDKPTYRFHIAGWGMSQRGNFSSGRGRLRKAGVTVKHDCTAACPLIWDVKDAGDGVSACYGDEGSPVVTKNPEPKLLVGLLLKPADDCHKSSVLNVVARRDWIHRIMAHEDEAFRNCIPRNKSDAAPPGDKKEKKTKSKTEAPMKKEVTSKGKY